MTSSVTQEPERLSRVEDVARRWGVSRTSVYGLIKSGDLRSLRIGGSRRIPASAEAEFVARHCADDPAS